MALQRVLDNTDIVFATAVAGRPMSAAGVVGPYARGLPIRLRHVATPARTATALAQAGEHADAPPLEILEAAGPGGMALLSRFFLTWLDPQTVPMPEDAIQVDWQRGRTQFATGSTDTEVLVGVVLHNGLHVHLNGGPRVHEVADALQVALDRAAALDCALVV
ncbi:MAG: hypothetical protein ACI9WU_002812 [Myxococcota bacterium]|jgi:hypothetical protein